MPPLVPGFVLTGEMSPSATGSRWAAVRTVDGRRLVLNIVPVGDMVRAQALLADQMALLDRVQSPHLIRQHSALALADGTVALVLDEVNGASLAQLVGARGQLSAGESVTIVAPLLRALADLHAVGLVHGHLAPGSILFTDEGRPLIGDFGVARLMGNRPGSLNGVGGGFVAPELIGGTAQPSPASDVYAMGALGWFCLTGTSPAPSATRQSLPRLRSEAPPRLVEVLRACLATDPTARPAAGAAAVDLFDAAPAETVAMVAVADPAAEITRRIRAAAVSGPTSRTAGSRRRQILPVFGAMALVVAVLLGVGWTWLLRRPQAEPAPALAGTATSLAHSSPPTTRPLPASATGAAKTAVGAAPSSPRLAGGRLLQGLLDARAHAYGARDAALLDLVYAPGATRSGADKGNITTARKRGGTYLGLSFVVRDVAFLDGSSGTARLRATVVTPAYQTGQPHGSKISHAEEVFGPSIFSLRLTAAGWRIADLTRA